MRKYNLIKTICIITIIITFLLSSYLTYMHLLDYHESKRISSHTLMYPKADENINMSMFKANKAGNPNDIQGIMAYYEDYIDNTLVIKIINVNDIDVKLLNITNKKGDLIYPFTGNNIMTATSGVPLYVTYEFNITDDDFAYRIDDIYIEYTYDNNIKRHVY